MSGQGPAPLPSLGLLLPTGYILSCAQGSYTYTGQAVGLLTVSYGISAPAPLPSLASLLRSATSGLRNPAPLPSISSLLGGVSSYVLTIEQGTYTYTGQEVLADYQISLGQGSYSTTGQTVALRTGRNMPITTGSYGVNGQAVNLVRSIICTIGSGSYSLSGQDVALRYASGRSLIALTGSYAVTGYDVALRHSYRLVCQSGTYSLNGQNLDFGYTEAVKETVPYLIGMLEQQARDVIAALHCTPNVISTGGTVVSQSPAFMTQVLRHTTITVTMGGAVNYTKLGRRNGLPPYNTNEVR